jgi:16S rRNA (cytosine967-C5)-methyltransferase
LKPAAHDVRALAVWVVEQTLVAKSPADRFIQQAEAGLPGRDRRLLRELGLGTLRWLRRLDQILESASFRPLQAVDPRLRGPLRVGAYQLLFLDRVPAHAAVNEAVEQARRRTHRGGAGFVNAVLRRIARAPSLAAWAVEEAEPIRRLGIEFSHPDLLVERWLGQFGEEKTRALLSANNQRKPVQLLVLAGRPALEQVAARLAEEGVETQPSTLSPVGLVVSSGDAMQTEAWRQGEIYLQDVASQSAALVPSPEPGERIADLAAAPGGKSFSLLAYEPRVKITAADRDLHRLLTVRQNRERLKQRLDLVLADGASPPWKASFDRVVLDLPCTGSGTLRKHPELKWRISEDEISRLSRQGLTLVEAAADLVCPGGLLSVVTCSIEPEENQGVVSRFLAGRPAFEPAEFQGSVPTPLFRYEVGSGQWQILPADVHDGFTVNVLRRRY